VKIRGMASHVIPNYKHGLGWSKFGCHRWSIFACHYQFVFIEAEFFFIYVYKNYIKSFCSETSLIDRSKRIVKELIANRPISYDDEKQIIYELLVLLKSTQQLFFEKHKDHFFMTDLFKENVTRFSVTFEQCMQFLED